MFRFSEIIRDFKGMNRFIGISFVLFFAGIVIGGTNPGFKSILESQIQALGQMVETIDSSSNPTLSAIIFIFLNNAIKSIYVLFFGVLFGILPVLFLLINGMVIGYLLQMIGDNPTGMSVMEVVFKGLLPHGIIEIPAIIIACAYSLRFGVLTWKAAGYLLFSRDKLSGVGDAYKTFLVRSVPVSLILVLALLLASVIESTFTVWLLNQ